MFGKKLTSAPYLFAIALFMTGCASAYTPIIDRQGVDEAQFQYDLTECRHYADQVDSVREGATGTLVGAGVGAALGAALGAIGGSPGTGAAFGASAGGIGGGASETGKAESRKKTIINNCLINRGYRILG